MGEPLDRCERVGIFGGSFDPIHNGHLDVADAALKRHRLDRVIFVPARQQPHKRSAPAASGEHRLAMVELAIRDEPLFSASDCELKRPGRSFTIDTIREFRDQFGPRAEIFFIVGSDSVSELPAWKSLRRLAELCTFVVAARPGWPLDELDKLSDHLPAERVAAIKDAAIDSTANRVSATEIRALVASGDPIAGLVPEPVAAYITRNKLYRAA